MITALNMTVPLKQDAESQAKLQAMKAGFADHIQPAIDEALEGRLQLRPEWSRGL